MTDTGNLFWAPLSAKYATGPIATNAAADKELRRRVVDAVKRYEEPLGDMRRSPHAGPILGLGRDNTDDMVALLGRSGLIVISSMASSQPTATCPLPTSSSSCSLRHQPPNTATPWSLAASSSLPRSCCCWPAWPISTTCR